MREAARFEPQEFPFEVVLWDTEQLLLVLRYGGEEYRWVYRDRRVLCNRYLTPLTDPQKRAMKKMATDRLEKAFQRQHQPVPDEHRVAS